MNWCVAALAGTGAAVMSGTQACEPDQSLRARAVQDALGLILTEDRAAPAELCRRAVEAAAPR